MTFRMSAANILQSDLQYYWKISQDKLHTLLHDHEIAEESCRFDSISGQLHWYNSRNATPTIIARSKLLCTFSLSTQSITLAWAETNSSGTNIAKIQGIPDIMTQCHRKDAEMIAMYLAKRTHAQYHYAIHKEENIYYFALWDIHLNPSQQASATANNPTFITQLLSSLAELLGDSQLSLKKKATMLKEHGKRLLKYCSKPTADHPQAQDNAIPALAEHLISMANKIDKQHFFFKKHRQHSIQQILIELQYLISHWRLLN